MSTMTDEERRIRAAAEALLTRSLQSQRSSFTQHSINRASDIVLSEDLIAGTRHQGRMSNVRRFFCLFVTFDLLLTCLMWLICTMLAGDNVETAFVKQVIRYNIKTSLFDIVMAAVCRFTVLLLFYALLYINHWIIIAISTAITCAFLITKVFLFDWPSSTQPVFEVLLILSSFVLAWSEAWFFDFRVIPQEMQARDWIIGSSGSERAPLLQHFLAGPQSHYTESVGNFYSPMESPQHSDDDMDDRVAGTSVEAKSPDKLVLPILPTLSAEKNCDMKRKFIALMADNFLSNEEQHNLFNIQLYKHWLNTIKKRKLYRIAVSFNREHHWRPNLYSELWIQLYTEYDFFMHFRMQRRTFEDLLKIIVRAPAIVKQDKEGFLPSTPEKVQQVSLYYLAHNVSLLLIGDKFNIATATVLNSVILWIKCCIQQASIVIRWPTQAERRLVEEKFRDLAGFPGVVGAIDGCHINVTAPADQQRCYQNRYSTHSIILQGICTADRLLTSVYVGHPGSANDCRVLSNSLLFKRIDEQNPSIFFSPDQHLLGDKIYPIKEWLIPPFKDYGHVTRMRTRFNILHSRTRVKIENCFALLKGRWRRLKHIHVYKIAKASQIIMAACILHNFCLLRKDFAESLIVEPHEVHRVNVVQLPGRDLNWIATLNKRDAIMRRIAWR